MFSARASDAADVAAQPDGWFRCPPGSYGDARATLEAASRLEAAQLSWLDAGWLPSASLGKRHRETGAGRARRAAGVWRAVRVWWRPRSRPRPSTTPARGPGALVTPGLVAAPPAQPQPRGT